MTSRDLLAQAVDAWVREHPAETARLDDTGTPSTTINQFLWAAEAAWDRASRVRVAHALAADPTHRWQAKVNELPRHIADGTPVVYYLYDQHDHLLYIGSTLHLRQRLGQHRHRFGSLLVRFSYDPCTSVDTALRLERERIAHHQPPHNVVGVHR